jgi:hypothetical protein
MQHKILDHARDRDDVIVRVGDYIHYWRMETSVRIEKIVHNYGGAVLFFNNGDRAAAMDCWVPNER